MAFCSNCGAKLNDNDKYCNNCGKSINSNNKDKSLIKPILIIMKIIMILVSIFIILYLFLAIFLDYLIFISFTISVIALIIELVLYKIYKAKKNNKEDISILFQVILLMLYNPIVGVLVIIDENFIR